ncbi:MAG: GNAT family N-acetyltransferase [Candidatus Woesearchaeota archaeon]
MIKIRGYQEKDTESIIKLVHEILFEVFNAEARNIEDLKNIKKEYFEKKGVFYVAEDDGKIVGTIAAEKETDRIARLKRMFVKKEYRKQKLGQRLLDQLLEFCKKKGYEKIILSTYPQMKAAIEFYKKNGFKEYKRNEHILFEKIL